MISVEDYLSFVDEALGGMVSIITQLGDELANRRPDLPGSNSPYVVLTHCLGVMEYWACHMVGGRTVQRDRDAEFRASGSVGDLVDRTRRARRQLEADLANLEPFAPPRGTPKPDDAGLPLARTQGGALSTCTRSWPSTGARWRAAATCSSLPGRNWPERKAGRASAGEAPPRSRHGVAPTIARCRWRNPSRMAPRICASGTPRRRATSR